MASQSSISFWSDGFSLPHFPPLEKNHETECLVIGAGIAGLTTAYLLLKAGKKVTIIDKGPIAGGQTSQTTGHLSNLLDDHFSELENYFGVEGLKKAVQSHGEAIKFIKNTGIACDFEELNAYLYLAEDDFSDILEKELKAAHQAKIEGAEIVTLPFDKKRKAFTMPHQAQFHPLKYMLGLTQEIQRMGGHIFLNTHVVELEGGDVCITKTSKNLVIISKATIAATNVPIQSKFVMHTKQAPYRTYVIAVEIEKNEVPKGLYYDTKDPYHYVRLYGENVLIVGSEDHKTGQEEHPLKCYERLEEWTQKRFPYKKVLNRWSGQVMEPVDSLGFMGADPLEKNLYLITGDSGNGLTHATIGAHIVTDLILGKDNPYLELYNPKRKNLKSGLEFIKENVNVAEQYLDWTKKEISSECSQMPCGMVVQREGKKVAIYKDEAGNEHEFSAVCPHLGCIVHWNEAEMSFDCPCHGSRFGCKGEVLCGPAVTPLKALQKA